MLLAQAVHLRRQLLLRLLGIGLLIGFIPIVCRASRLEGVDFIGQRKGSACQVTEDNHKKNWNFGCLCNPLSTSASRFLCVSSVHIQELKLLEGVLG